ncbi:copper/silver efflux system outer membrane protein CusC [Raoultella ornithinolytica]|nr:copper/silver efflux system outer membrane protein CusC [Raoultella ornithinolytica]
MGRSAIARLPSFRTTKMLNERRAWRLLFTAGAGLVLTACTTLGPDYHPPKTPELSHWQPATQRMASRSTPADYARWWTQLNDPTLTALINEALRKNPDVKIAGLRLLESRAQLGSPRVYWDRRRRSAAAICCAPASNVRETIAQGPATAPGSIWDGRSISGVSFSAASNPPMPAISPR